MLSVLKNLGRAIIPKSLFRAAQPFWHGGHALLASLWYGHPSDKLTVIGVTGTAGKSTTVNLLATILNNTGHKAGFITTTNYFDGQHEALNFHGLTMPNGWVIQKSLRDMVRLGCKYAVIEASSEGMAQNRHLGINFDMALFTNLSPAHIDNHGSFENYKRAKGRLFNALHKNKKIIGVNLDNTFYEYFAHFPANEKFGVTLHDAKADFKTYTIKNITAEPKLAFDLNSTRFDINLIGEFNVANAALAIAAADELGIPLSASAAALSDIKPIPGRMETIANSRGIQIFVDYAPEPPGMKQALQTVKTLPHNRLIHVFGSTGGFRDVQKRFDFGALSGQFADIIIITNDDVYDSDPEEIAQAVRKGINSVGSKAQVLEILDRRTAIGQALKLAQAGDIVIINGKGSEQFLILPGNKRIKWDDREVVREELNKL